MNEPQYKQNLGKKPLTINQEVNNEAWVHPATGPWTEAWGKVNRKIAKQTDRFSTDVSGAIGKDYHLEDPNVVQRILKRSEAFKKVKGGHKGG